MLGAHSEGYGGIVAAGLFLYSVGNIDSQRPCFRLGCFREKPVSVQLCSCVYSTTVYIGAVRLLLLLLQ